MPLLCVCLVCRKSGAEMRGPSVDGGTAEFRGGVGAASLFLLHPHSWFIRHRALCSLFWFKPRMQLHAACHCLHRYDMSQALRPIPCHDHPSFTICLPLSKASVWRHRCLLCVRQERGCAMLRAWCDIMEKARVPGPPLTSEKRFGRFRFPMECRTPLVDCFGSLADGGQAGSLEGKEADGCGATLF